MITYTRTNALGAIMPLTTTRTITATPTPLPYVPPRTSAPPPPAPTVQVPLQPIATVPKSYPAPTSYTTTAPAIPRTTIPGIAPAPAPATPPPAPATPPTSQVKPTCQPGYTAMYGRGGWWCMRSAEPMPPTVQTPQAPPPPSVSLPKVPTATVPRNGTPATVKPLLQLVPPTPARGPAPPEGSPEPPPSSPARAPYDWSSRFPVAAPRFETVPSAFPVVKPPMSKGKKVAIAATGGVAVTGIILALVLL